MPIYFSFRIFECFISVFFFILPTVGIFEEYLKFIIDITNMYIDIIEFASICEINFEIF